jgi:uncharacterized LabA/DUF88 family protein
MLFGRNAGMQLLRVYWYDGSLDPSDNGYRGQRRYFNAIANTPGVQLRLGHLKRSTPSWHYPLRQALEAMGVDANEFAEHFEFKPQLSQKGVDTLIVLDLVRLGQEASYDTAVLVAGDRDLAEAVRTAQDAGRRVVLAHPEGAGVAQELRQLADHVVEIGVPHLSRMFATPEPAAPPEEDAVAEGHEPAEETPEPDTE